MSLQARRLLLALPLLAFATLTGVGCAADDTVVEADRGLTDDTEANGDTVDEDAVTVQQFPVGTVLEATDPLNFRSSPQIADNRIQVLPEGTTVTVRGTNNGSWVPISYRGTNGWAHGAYLKSTGGTTSGGNSDCSSGDGFYCGGNGVSGDTNTLYYCRKGVPQVSERCGSACQRQPNGTPDRCPAPSTGQVGGTPGNYDAINRAREWVRVGMPYCGGSNGGKDYICGGTCRRSGAANNSAWNAYRSDCSGLVSYSWALPAPGLTTRGFAPAGSGGRTVDFSDLRPGDALNSPQGHVILFVRWEDKSAGKARVIEEYSCSKTATERFKYLKDEGGSKLEVVGDSRQYYAIRKD